MNLTKVAPTRWAVREDENSDIAGFVEFHGFTNQDGKETGFWIGHAAEGKGWKAQPHLRTQDKTEAAEFVLKPKEHYHKRKAQWKEKL